MLNFIISFILIFTTGKTDVKSFEGSIELMQKSFYDTSFFTYTVKDENVRVDKFDGNHFLLQSLLINLDKQEIYILSPNQKLYTKLNTKNIQNNPLENFIILKTENSRMVGDYLCYQWRVKNIDRNTEVAYWVSQNNFYFFEDLIKLIASSDRTYEFFEKIPETDGFFPMLSVERTLLRREKSRVSVININNFNVNDQIFNIPSDYQKVVN